MMRTLYKSPTLLLLLASAPLYALDFETALERGLNQPEQLQAERLQIEAWSSREQASRHLRRPRANIDLTAGRYGKDFSDELDDLNQQIPPPFGSIDHDGQWQDEGLRATARVTLPLYTGGQIPARREQASAGLERAQAQYQGVRNDYTGDLTEAYFGLQLAHQVTRIQSERARTLDEHLHRAQRFHDQGLISRVELLQIEAARDEARRDLAQAEREQSRAHRVLQHLTAMEGHTLCLTTPLAMPAVDPEHLSALINDHPALLEIQQQIRQADAQVRIEESAMRPEIFAFGQRELNLDMTPLAEPDWAVGIGLNWSLSSGTGRRQQAAAASADRERAQVGLAQARRETELAAELALDRLQTAFDHADLLHTEAELAEARLELEQRSLEMGQATTLDVSEAVLQHSTVAVQQARNQFDALLALADLLRARGQSALLPDFLPAPAEIPVTNTTSAAENCS